MKSKIKLKYNKNVIDLDKVVLKFHVHELYQRQLAINSKLQFANAILSSTSSGTYNDENFHVKCCYQANDPHSPMKDYIISAVGDRRQRKQAI